MSKPKLEDILKLYSKKDLWEQNQTKIKIIDNQKKQIQNLQEQLQRQQKFIYTLEEDNLDLSYDKADNVYETAKQMAEGWEKSANERIAELEEQLKNAIVPKFKIGEYIYSVRPFMRKILCAEGYVTSITQLKDYSIHYHLETEPNELGYKNQFRVEERDCYKTMEETHEASERILKELQGENK